MTKKLALLIGINYEGTKHALKGCINDVQNLTKFLKDKMSFTEIITMTDRSKGSEIPNTKNVINILRNLVTKVNSDKYEEVWISFSGHGSFIKDYDGDELDGNDECLITLDGYIVDDLFYDIVSDIRKETKCVCLFDCCHSGTFADMRYDYTIDLPNNKAIANINYKKCPFRACRTLQKKKRKSCNSQIITINGCRDNQTSADYYDRNVWKWQGALTTNFLKCINNKLDISCHELLYEVNKLMILEGFGQRPVISSSKNIGLNHKFLFN